MSTSSEQGVDRGPSGQNRQVIAVITDPDPVDTRIPS
jgi:hypothetical protein